MRFRQRPSALKSPVRTGTKLQESDPVDAWLQREVLADRLEASPTSEQLSIVARIVLDANGHRNGAVAKAEMRRLAKVARPP
jgi:hypothetical protein